MNRTVGLTLALACAWTLLSPSPVHALAQQGGLEATVIPCTSAESTVPKVEISAARNRGFRVITAEFQKDGAVYRGRIQLSAGHYWVRVTLGKCHDEAPVTIDANGFRHVLFALSTTYILVTEGTNWLYGSVPVFVGSVELRSAKHFRYIASATMDNGGYYFEFLPPGTYIVRFMVGKFIVQRTVTINPSPAGSGTVLPLTLTQVQSAIARS